MISVNTVILSGHLGGPPEEKRTASGKLLCSLRLATSRWEARTNEEGTDWHTVIVWERQAENCIKFLRKGSAVLVEGRLTTRQWDGSDGKKHTVCEVVAYRVTFLSSGSGASDQAAQAAFDAEARTEEKARPPRAPSRPASTAPTVVGFGADAVPF
jgi:single-strand DNA-binding protein